MKSNGKEEMWVWGGYEYTRDGLISQALHELAYNPLDIILGKLKGWNDDALRELLIDFCKTQLTPDDIIEYLASSAERIDE